MEGGEAGADLLERAAPGGIGLHPVVDGDSLGAQPMLQVAVAIVEGAQGRDDDVAFIRIFGSLVPGTEGKS